MIEYDSQSWSTFLRLQGSVLPKACMAAFFPAVLALALKICDQEGIISVSSWKIITNSSAYSGFTWTLSFVLVFRTSQCYARFVSCSSGVCTMQAQMLEGASSLLNFASMSKKPKSEVDDFRNKLIRLFSLLHAMALTVIADQKDENYPVLDIESIPDKYIAILKTKSGKQKAELVYQWINALIIRSLDNGLLNVPPPILSRVFQELEKSMVEFNQVLQIMRISFPFPYAQVTIIMIWFYLLFTPFVMTAWTSQAVMAALFTFLSTSALLGLEMIAAELENPFGDDHNDLPCHDFQDELNEGLLLLMEPASTMEFVLGPNVATHAKLKDRSTWHSFDEEIADHHIEAMCEIDPDDPSSLEADLAYAVPMEGSRTVQQSIIIQTPRSDGAEVKPSLASVPNDESVACKVKSSPMPPPFSSQISQMESPKMQPLLPYPTARLGDEIVAHQKREAAPLHVEHSPLQPGNEHLTRPLGAQHVEDLEKQLINILAQILRSTGGTTELLSQIHSQLSETQRFLARHGDVAFGKERF